MTTAQTVDLADWLIQIWDEEEEAARFALDLTERAYPADEFDIEWRWARLSSHKTSGGGGSSFEPGAPSPASVLARIAADRKILARYERACARADDPNESALVRNDWGVIASTYETVLCELASPYADHPGFREEWR